MHIFLKMFACAMHDSSHSNGSVFLPLCRKWDILSTRGSAPSFFSLPSLEFAPLHFSFPRKLSRLFLRALSLFWRSSTWAGARFIHATRSLLRLAGITLYFPIQLLARLLTFAGLALVWIAPRFWQAVVFSLGLLEKSVRVACLVMWRVVAYFVRVTEAAFDIAELVLHRCISGTSHLLVFSGTLIFAGMRASYRWLMHPLIDTGRAKS